MYDCSTQMTISLHWRAQKSPFAGNTLNLASRQSGAICFLSSVDTKTDTKWVKLSGYEQFQIMLG